MTRKRKKDRHLPQCVYQHHGSFVYVKNGRWIRLGKTLTEALAEYARIQEKPTGGMVRLIDDALDQMKPGLKPSTAKQYEQAAKKLREILADFSPEQVKPKHIASIKIALRDTPNMANRCLSVLRSIFALAVEWQIVESNPCIGIKRHAESKRDRFLTDSEVEAIKKHASKRMQCVIDLLYLTGQRVTDVIGIRLADLTPEGIAFKQRKTGAKLLVAWTPDLRDAVERAKGLGENIRHLSLFYTRTGGIPSYRTVRDEWDAACRKAGIEDAHMHDLRAKSLTHARRQGLDATALAGHASRAMTERYIRQRETPVVVGPTFAPKSK